MFEKSWQSLEVPTDRKTESLSPIVKKENKSKPWYLWAGQSHLSAHHDHGTDPPGNSGIAHGK